MKKIIILGLLLISLGTFAQPGKGNKSSTPKLLKDSSATDSIKVTVTYFADDNGVSFIGWQDCWAIRTWPILNGKAVESQMTSSIVDKAWKTLNLRFKEVILYNWK